MSSSAVNKSILTENNINRVNCRKRIIKTNSKISETGFFIRKIQLFFAELRQDIGIARILNHLNTKCYI